MPATTYPDIASHLPTCIQPIEQPYPHRISLRGKHLYIHTVSHHQLILHAHGRRFIIFHQTIVGICTTGNLEVRSQPSIHGVFLFCALSAIPHWQDMRLTLRMKTGRHEARPSNGDNNMLRRSSRLAQPNPEGICSLPLASLSTVLTTA
jgi:hypothetical protein